MSIKFNLVDIAREYATEKHKKVNHTYDGHPYEYHLSMVVGFIYRFSDLIPSEDYKSVIAAGWGHDLIEDTRETYNDVKYMLGEQVADIIYALTNEKGKTRDERANSKYYEGIKSTPYAIFVKLCDRLANVTYSKNMGSSMFGKYKKENENFINHVIPFDRKEFYSPLINELNNLFK